MLAADAALLAADESLMEPAVDVTLMADADEELVIKALAPKMTCRPDNNVIVPECDVTVEAIVMSPVDVAAVNDTLPPVVIAPFTVNPLPDVSVTVPDPDVIAALVAISLVAPMDITLTVPVLPALIAPLTVINPAEAVTLILPVAFVVIPPILTFPVDIVNVTFAPFKTILVKSVVNTPGVTVYVVKPMPASMSMVCTVLTLAVTVNAES